MINIWYTIDANNRVVWTQHRNDPGVAGPGLLTQGPVAYDVVPSIAGDPGWVLGAAPLYRLRAATVDEWRAAGRDEAFNASERQRYITELRQALRDVNNDPLVQPSVKTCFLKMLEYVGNV